MLVRMRMVSAMSRGPQERPSLKRERPQRGKDVEHSRRAAEDLVGKQAVISDHDAKPQTQDVKDKKHREGGPRPEPQAHQCEGMHSANDEDMVPGEDVDFLIYAIDQRRVGRNRKVVYYGAFGSLIGNQSSCGTSAFLGVKSASISRFRRTILPDNLGSLF